MKLYILKKRFAYEVSSPVDWAKWMQNANRNVGRKKISGILVSTVFLGIDHNFWGEGDPLLFETLVFLPDGTTGQMMRYATWAEAKAGHDEFVDAIKSQNERIKDLTIDLLAGIIGRTRAA